MLKEIPFVKHYTEGIVQMYRGGTILIYNGGDIPTKAIISNVKLKEGILSLQVNLGFATWVDIDLNHMDKRQDFVFYKMRKKEKPGEWQSGRLTISFFG